MFLFYGLIWTFYAFSVVVLNSQLGLGKTLGANLVSVSFGVALVATLVWGSFLTYIDERIFYLKVVVFGCPFAWCLLSLAITHTVHIESM